MEFVCDAMLARLGRWLRMLGHDTLIATSDLDDEKVLAMSKGRILITRDEELYERARKRGVVCILLRSKTLEKQLEELLEHGVKSETDTSRCTICNGELEEIAEGYYVCRKCGKVYWEGSHWRNIEKVIEKLKENAHKGKDEEQ